MSMFADGLDAVHKAFARPVLETAPAQMRYLVRHRKGARAVAQLLRIVQRTVERYVKNQITQPRPGVAARQEREVTQRWQLQIRARARHRAATTDGIVIDTRARLGCTAPIGSTDQDRVRHLTVTLPPHYAAQLFGAREAGVSGARLREIAAEALKDVYFQDGGRRACSLEEKSASRTSSTSSSTCNSQAPACGARAPGCRGPRARPAARAHPLGSVSPQRNPAQQGPL
ncbi:hypothetical protein SUDANB43_07409 [Streptomyces sp. enrichment culture]